MFIEPNQATDDSSIGATCAKRIAPMELKKQKGIVSYKHFVPHGTSQTVS